ncbi:MAG: hypothetical protein KDD82_13005, partial [Planctomycetes bacterium]|nr:hypothetical protein [Planctomycetota bacterium]
FGLAKDVGGARDVTVSGEVLGTPSYMAPEQAAGDLAQIDRRADVYGLGATLYAALAGRAPFAGGSVLATLEQVAKDEPTPPRKLNPAVDLDLETICLRCLEKDPAERYPTAGAVRDDLRRFLAERPILARRYGLRDLARKWLRRNRTLAGVSAGLIGLALAVIVAGSVWFSLRLSAALEAAEHSAAEARLEAERAEQERERAQRAERLAEAEAEAAQEVAQIAAGTLGQLALEVHEELSHLPGPRARELRRRIAEHTRADLEQLRAAGVGGPTLSQLEVLSLQQQVETLEEDKADTEALALGLEAVARSRALLDALPADADLEQSLALSGLLARSLDGAGSMQLSAGNAAAGRALLEEGLALRRADLARSPDDPGLLQNLAVSLRSVAELDEAEGKLAEALPLHEQWLTVCERVEANSPQSLRFAYETCLARCGLANLRAQTGDAPRAREAFARAAEALRALLERDPTDHASRKLLAQCLIGQADVERWQHHEERALELQVQALEESRRLLREDPTDEARWAVARALYALGITRADLERFAEARAALGEANAVFAELVEGEPEDLVKRQGWASCLGQEASLALATGDLVAAREGFASAAREFVALLDLRPAEGQLRRNLGVLQAKLAAVEVAAQDPAQALVHLAAAEATLLPLGEGAAPDVEVVYQLQRLHVDACGLCGGQGDAEAARAHADQALRWAKRFFALTPDHPNALTDLTNAHHRVAQLALEAGDPARGLPHAVEAVRLVEARIEVDASNPTVYRNRSIYLALEARLRQALGDPLGALERCDAAFEHHLRVAARQPELSYEVRTFAWDRVLALAEALKAPDAELVARGLQIVRDYARISAAECHALRGMREGASAEDRATIDQRLTERQAVIELLRCDPRWAPLDADGALGAALDAAQ